MTLKAVLFDFNGVIINDEALNQKLIAQILVEENLCPKPGEDREVCLGRSDRACLGALLNSRGRVVSETQLLELLKRKARAYEQERLLELPLYPGLEDLIFQLRSRSLKLALVSETMRSEVDIVLSRANLAEYFTVIVTGDDVVASLPEPDGYLLTVERLNQQNPDLNLQPCECLMIEDTLTGIAAAKRAGIPVVGVANTYPFHMLQRQANWTVDYLCDLEIDRVQQVYSRTETPMKVEIGGMS